MRHYVAAISKRTLVCPPVCLVLSCSFPSARLLFFFFCFSSPFFLIPVRTEFLPSGFFLVLTTSSLGSGTGLHHQTRITGRFSLITFVLPELIAVYMNANRKGHYIVAEYVDKIVNKHSPTYPWQVCPSPHHALSVCQNVSDPNLPLCIVCGTYPSPIFPFIQQFSLTEV